MDKKQFTSETHAAARSRLVGHRRGPNALPHMTLLHKPRNLLHIRPLRGTWPGQACRPPGGGEQALPHIRALRAGYNLVSTPSLASSAKTTLLSGLLLRHEHDSRANTHCTLACWLLPLTRPQTSTPLSCTASHTTASSGAVTLTPRPEQRPRTAAAGPRRRAAPLRGGAHQGVQRGVADLRGAQAASRLPVAHGHLGAANALGQGL
jgi:hypothetical protein